MNGRESIHSFLRADFQAVHVHAVDFSKLYVFSIRIKRKIDDKIIIGLLECFAMMTSWYVEFHNQKLGFIFEFLKGEIIKSN